jgi:RNA-directed DNA polymerase
MHLVHILYRAPHRYPYREFRIAKRSGGMRKIAAPHPTIAVLQAKLNTVFQLVYSPRPSVHGFRQQRSVLTNALGHTGKRFVLNLDLEDFFPAIHFGRVRGMFMHGPYDLGEEAATVLAQICCTEDGLPQGAPSSPIISNMICARLDGQLQRLAKNYRCTYTRYADDLTFSTTMSLFPRALASPAKDSWAQGDVVLGSELVDVIESNDFRINHKKVRIQDAGSRQAVTGITVNKFPNVRRRYVRQIRAMIHAWEKYGRNAAEAEFLAKYDRRSRNPDLRVPEFGRVIRGKLDYLSMVTGTDSRAYRGLWNKLHELDPQLAPHALAPRDINGTNLSDDTVWRHWFGLYRDQVLHAEVKNQGATSGGTAFIFGRGLLATCSHVVRGGEVTVTLGGSDFRFSQADAHYHGFGPDRVDAALIRPGRTPSNSRLRVREEPVEPGEQVAALGYPPIAWAQPALAIRTGIVEAITMDFREQVQLLVVSVHAAGGMSGGPVIDRGGRLVGIVMQNSWGKTKTDVTEQESSLEYVPKDDRPTTDNPPEPYFQVLPIRYLVEIAHGIRG